jgi:hypothetical protein
MQFVIKNIQANLQSFKYKLLRQAHLIIIAHRLSPGEIKLNQYLEKNYKLNLKNACLYLLAKSKIYRDMNNNIIVLFPNKDDDKLASLITYGNLELRGSKLLKLALFRD